METLIVILVFAAVALIGWLAYKLKIYLRK
jgi:hypothetical protein